VHAAGGSPTCHVPFTRHHWCWRKLLQTSAALQCLQTVLNRAELHKKTDSEYALREGLGVLRDGGRQAQQDCQTPIRDQSPLRHNRHLQASRARASA
jgi:hypothetical protein